MRVAVIGHGASAEGAGLGETIDGCGLVVRMHDCHWQTPEDYGQRWDVGVLPGPWNGKWEKTRQGAPSIGWWAYALSKNNKIPESVAGLPVQRTNMAWTINHLLREGMDRAAPTRGLCAALIAMQIVKPSSLVMIGFDRLRAGRTIGMPYTVAQAAVDGGAASANGTHQEAEGLIIGPHHFGAERDLLLARAQESGCDVMFLPGAMAA